MQDVLDFLNKHSDALQLLIAAISLLAAFFAFLLGKENLKKLFRNFFSFPWKLITSFGQKKLPRNTYTKSNIFNIDNCNFKQSPKEQILTQLNSKFSEQAQLLGQSDQTPLLRSLGHYEAPIQLSTLASEYRSNPQINNEPHALLTNMNSISLAGSSSLSYWNTDYATIKALRDNGIKPPIIGAGAIVGCSEAGKIILQRRDINSATYPNAVHIFGGSFQPDQAIKTNDRDDLELTAAREVNEETGKIIGAKSFKLNNIQPFIGFELTTGFFQCVFAGIDLKYKSFKKLANSPEGDVLMYDLTQLKHELNQPYNWVPSGQMHLIYWLSKGAPTTDGTCMFKDADKCRKIADQFLAKDIKSTWQIETQKQI